MAYIILHSYNNYVDAHIVKGVLEEAGIASWLKDENTVSIDPILTNAVGGIKVMVKEEEAQQAWALLAQLKRDHAATIQCPKCNSVNTELVSTPRKPVNWVSAALTFFLGDYAIGIDKVQHCFDCNHEFVPPETREGV